MTPDSIWIDLLKAEEFRRYLEHPEWLRQEILQLEQNSPFIEILPAKDFAAKLWQGRIF